ncbi:hypothetical protein BX600DRAFT_26435 [Xylariales sp. PMI_506]|nr:hypothetical protein BX600DRAFT_26435 [Xylariales sp. PMI_506]
MASSKHAQKVRLIPWDPTSEQQVERMYDQRVACGWRAEEVPAWVESAKSGKRIFYWVILTDKAVGRNEMLEMHLKAYPKEAAFLTDTAQEIYSTPRQPTGEEFNPIGHVALEVHSGEEDEKLGLPPKGAVWIHGLYISYVLQNAGLGAAAMDHIETVAAQAPLNGKMVVIDTIAAEMQLRPEVTKPIYADRGIPVPTKPLQEWYARRDYELFNQLRAGYTLKHASGSLVLDIVYMRKIVG